MAVISPSTKFTTQQKQFQMASDRYVLLRLVMEGGTYTVMTATAAEDDGKHVPFPQQEMLIQAAVEAFSQLGRPAQYKTDAWGRAYVEFREIDGPRQIRHQANRVAEALGLSPVTGDHGQTRSCGTSGRTKQSTTGMTPSICPIACG